MRSDTQLLGDLGEGLRSTLLWLISAVLCLLAVIVFLVRRGLAYQLDSWRPEMELLALWGAPPWRIQLPFLLIALQQALWPLPLLLLLLWAEKHLAQSFGFHLQLGYQHWIALALILLLQALVWPVVRSRVRRCYYK